MAIHHKVPRSRGGSDDEWNLVELSPFEHAYEHALDFVLFPEISPQFDFRQPGWPLLPEDLQLLVRQETSRRMMGNQITKGMKCRQGKKLTEEHKRALIIANTGRRHTDEARQKMSEWQIGKITSEETKRKISETLTGRKLKEETKQKISETNKGRPKSEETKKKMSEARKGEKKPIIECPHCGKKGGGAANMTRWHFDNCPHKTDSLS